MAIQSLEQRLDQLAVESESKPALEIEPEQSTQDADNEKTLVAGLGPLVKLGKGLVKKGEEARAAEAQRTFTMEEQANQAAAKNLIVKPGDESNVAPATPDAPTAPAQGVPDEPAMQVPPAKPSPLLEDPAAQLEKFEKNIGQARTRGKPPVTNINLTKIKGSNDFKRTVDALSKATGMEVSRLSWDEILKSAKQRKLGPNLIIDLENIKQQFETVPRELLTLRLAAYENAQEFYQIARSAYLNPDDQILQQTLLERLTVQNYINEAYGLARARTAQAQSVGGLMITPGKAKGMLDDKIGYPQISDADMKKMLQDPNISTGLRELIEKFVQLENDGAREGLLNQVSKFGIVKELWDRTWKNGLLSATGTHIVNLSSSTTFLASSVATRALAGLYGSAKRTVGLNGEVELGESAAMIAGMIHSFREAMGLGWTAMKTGTTREMRSGMTEVTSDAGKKLEGQYNTFDARDYGIETEWFAKGLNGYANFVTLLGGRPIMAMDEVFKLMGYRAELYAQAYRRSSQVKREALAEGKTAKEADQAGLEQMGKVLSEPPPEVDAVATDFGHMITFSRKLTGASAAVQNMAQDHLVGRIILPFVKAPVWVTSESMQHSLFAPLSGQWRRDMKAGGAKRELAMAKFGMGSMFMMAMGSYVADGRITGGGPGNNNLRKIYYESGWRPYSFVFQSGEWDAEFVSYLKGLRIDPSISKDGRLYVPYRGLDPVSGPLAMIADATEYARYEQDQNKINEVVLGAAWGLYGYVGQMPFMQGISSIAGAFAQSVPNPKAAFRNALDSLVQTATQYGIEGSPVGVFNSARRSVERIEDPNKRITAESPDMPVGVKGFYQGLNKVIVGTPFLSSTLPQDYDYLGQPMSDVDPSAPWLASLSGIRFSESKQRAADKILIQLGMSIQKPKMRVSIDGVSVALEPEEYSYMMRQLGIVTDGAGNNVANAIVALANSEGFGILDKDEKQKEMAEEYADFKAMALRDLIDSKFGPAIQMRVEREKLRRPRYGIYK